MTPQKPPECPVPRPRPKGTQDAYAKRNAILAQLGYANFSAYRRSPLWKNIRRRVRARDKGKCTLCGNRAYRVRLLNYSKATLTGKNLAGLRTICKYCIAAAHAEKPGRPLLEAVHAAIADHARNSGRRQRRVSKRDTLQRAVAAYKTAAIDINTCTRRSESWNR